MLSHSKRETDVENSLLDSVGVGRQDDMGEWPSSKSLQTINAEEVMEKREPSSMLVGM